MNPARDPSRDLAARREVLLARRARLRDEIADDVHDLQRGAGLVDRGVGLLDRGIGLLGRGGSTGRPGLIVPLALAGGLLLAVGGPRRALRLAGRALTLWPIVRPFVPRVAALIAARRAAPAPPRTR
jgi:hypothetical protein